MAVRNAETSLLDTDLGKRTVEGELYERLQDNRVRCYACGHRCVILDGLPGICKVRFNERGKLFVPRNYVGALQCDPVEKKPFFHALPGSQALSFGMLGCDLHCAYCQNWVTSQALRDPNAVSPIRELSAHDLVRLAQHAGARILASTYNEPLITSEWAVEVFKRAREAGFKTAYISNGNGTPEVLDYLQPWVDFYKVDLKSFQDRNYRKLGGRLDPILETIQQLFVRKFWLEIVTLVIPGFNDSTEELTDIANFLAEISPDIPWHVSAFHQDYRMTDPDNTPAATLVRACEIGKEAGLRYVYAGNLPGQLGHWENTYCHQCNALLVERRGFRILRNQVKQGTCPSCHATIPGVWE